MTFKLLFAIAFWIIIVGCGGWLIWELIPDFVKKYWNYQKMLRVDRKKGQRRKYIFSFRNGVGRK